MAGIFRSWKNTFNVTPHKICICVLLQIYASPSSIFHRLILCKNSSTSTRNDFGLFLFSATKSCQNPEEPRLDLIKSQLKIILGSQNHAVYDHLICVLSSFTSPDDLFVFFNDLRQLLDRIGSISLVDDPVFLESSSDLGLFLRRCILAFDHMHFESVSHLLTDIESYTKIVLRDSYVFTNPSGESPLEIDATNTAETLAQIDNRDEQEKHDSMEEQREFLHSSSQLHGYLTNKSDSIDIHDANFSSNSFDRELKQLEILSPDLKRIHYLRFLNDFHRSDYPTALENLHRYFDYTAGIEDFDSKSTISSTSLPHGSGKYELGLFCLGILHFHLQHMIPAIEIFTEAVRVSQQQNNDSSLAYTMSVICTLFFEPGFSSRLSKDQNSTKSPLSIHQQLFLLLRRSLKRSQILNLHTLISSSHLGIAKFNMIHIQRPLFISGSIHSSKLKTNPIDAFESLNSSFNSIFNYEIPPPNPLSSSKSLKNLQNRPKTLISSPQTLQNFRSTFLLRSTAAEIYGIPSFSSLNSYIYAICSSPSSSTLISTTKLLQQMSIFKGPKAAIKALQKSFPKLSNPHLHILNLQLLHDKALHTSNLTHALHLCDEIGSMASPTYAVDMDLKLQSTLRRSITLISAKEYKKAEEILISLFSTCYFLNMNIEIASVLVLLADLHKKAGNSCLGVQYAMAAISYADSLNMDMVKAFAGLILGELYMIMGWGQIYTEISTRFLYRSFAQIVGHGGMEICARAYVLEAKCLILDSEFCLMDRGGIVLNSLRKAGELLELLEFHEMAAEAFYLMAVVCDRMLRMEERDAAAESFRVHVLAYQNQIPG